jgi:cytochrome c oxidase subunit 4
MIDITAAEEHHVNVRAYLFIFGILLFLTVVTVLVSYWHLPPTLAVLVALAIATLKASLVAAFFMHLKGERVIIYGLLGLTVFFVGLLFVLPSTDFHLLSDRTTHTPVVITEAAP